MDTRSINRIGMAGGLGGLGAGLFGMFGGGNKNPYGAASGYYNQIPDELKKYFDPYIGAGQNALGTTQSQYGNLINDPGSMLNKFGAGYQQSPGYQFQMNQAMNAANNAAAAGGMAGSPQHQQQAMTVAQGLANQDYYNYLSKVLGLYGTGLQGMGHIGDMGFQASSGLGEDLASSLMNQGNLAFSGQAAKNQSQGADWGNVFGGLGALGSFSGLFDKILPFMGL